MGCSRVTVTAALLGALCGPAPVRPALAVDFRVEAAYTYDDNVTRSEGAGNVLSDRFFTVSASASHIVRHTANTRSVLQLLAGGDVYDKYDGLTRYFGGFQGEFQYRPSGEFGAPTYGIFLKGFVDEYDSELRDGYRYSAGVRVLKPLTDRIEVFAALAYNKRDGKSTVFDTEDYSARVNLDYSLGRRGTVYLGGEYRNGDVVSVSPASLPLITIAEAVVQDDVFTGRLAYRIKASTVITTLGYNLALGERHSLDFSWRWVQSTATEDPGFGTAGKPEYKVNQYSVAYLFRF